MKKLYLLLPLLLAFTFLTCDDDKTKDDPPPPTLDQRLVGGRWYFWNKDNISQPVTANGYYEFKNELTFIHYDRSNQSTEISVYTNNGTVYRKDNNQELLKYQFITSYPYPNTSEFGMPDHKRYLINQIAANNNLISCTVSNQNLNLIDNVIIQYQFLRRFKPDGTTYE